MEFPVLVRVVEASEGGERGGLSSRVITSYVRLRVPDESPRLAALGDAVERPRGTLRVSVGDVVEPPVLGVGDWESMVLTGSSTLRNEDLGDRVVKNGAEVVEVVACNQREFIGLGPWLAVDEVVPLLRHIRLGDDGGLVW